MEGIVNSTDLCTVLIMSQYITGLNQGSPEFRNRKHAEHAILHIYYKTCSFIVLITIRSFKV